MLKNISEVVQVIKYDGRQYPVVPGQTFDVKSMDAIGAIGDQDAVCLEEKWWAETGGKLARVAPEAPKAKPEKDPDGKPYKPSSPSEKEAAKEATSTPKPSEKVDPKANKEEKSGGKGKNANKRGKK